MKKQKVKIKAKAASRQEEILASTGADVDIIKNTPVYKIQYSYQTGDSFSTEDREDVLEYEWSSLELAQEALARIKEHYEWYCFKEGFLYHRDKEIAAPKWLDINCGDGFVSHHMINLRISGDKEIQFWCPWCGYFERLYDAEIIIENDKNKISFR